MDFIKTYDQEISAILHFLSDMMTNEYSNCAIIIVTYNSEKHIHRAIECINRQTKKPRQIIIIDSGSKDASYLTLYQQIANFTVVFADKDIGFCKGNNIGMTKVEPDCEYVFFLNPDAFLTPDFLEKAQDFMEMAENKKCGALTGTIIGYDIEKDQPRRTYDSTGVFRKWFGQWYDRDQGKPYHFFKYQNPEIVPAICGAVLFCRKEALNSIQIRGQEFFDNQFYMYKEDIDLSIRLRQKEWNLIFVPQVIAYHCRGWIRDRSRMPRKMRLCSARNELKVQLSIGTLIPITYSLAKYAAVKILNF